MSSLNANCLGKALVVNMKMDRCVSVTQTAECSCKLFKIRLTPVVSGWFGSLLFSLHISDISVG